MLWTAACMMEETSGSKWLNMGDLNPRRGLVAAEVEAGVDPDQEEEEAGGGGLGLAPGPRGTEGGDVLGPEIGGVGAGREGARIGPGPRSRGAAAEADPPRRSAQEVEVLRGRSRRKRTGTSQSPGAPQPRRGRDLNLAPSFSSSST